MKKLYAVEVWVEETMIVCVAADDKDEAEAIAESCAEMDDSSWESSAERITTPKDIPQGWEHMHPIEGDCTCMEWFEEGPIPPDPRQLAIPGTEEE